MVSDETGVRVQCKWREKQCTAIVDWESLSSFYCELDFIWSFQEEKKKKSLLTCGLGHKLLREDSIVYSSLCIHDVDYIVHQLGDARIKNGESES